jgi:hypothetical protein
MSCCNIIHAQGIDVTHVQARLEALGDVAQAAGDLAGHEGFATAWRFVVEQHAVTGVHAIGFTVVDGDPVGVQLGHRVRRAWVERRGFALRGFLHQAVQLGGGRLVEARGLFQAQQADGLQQAQGAHAVDVGGVFRRFEAHGHVGLGAEVIDFVRLYFLDQAGQVGRVAEVAVVQEHVRRRHMRILVDVVDPLRIERGGATLDAVNFVPFFQQQFRQVRAVLTRDTGDERAFLFHSSIPLKREWAMCRRVK